MSELTKAIIEMINNGRIVAYKYNGHSYKSLDDLIDANFPTGYFPRKYFYALAIRMIEDDQIGIITKTMIEYDQNEKRGKNGKLF